MMTRIVNGITVTLTDEEESAVLSEQEVKKLHIKLKELALEADSRIEHAVPAKDRDKLMARTLELLELKIDGAITADELIELASYRSMQQTARTIRAAEEAIKAEVESAPDPLAIDITKHISWP